MPRCNVWINFMSPVIYYTPAHLVLTNLFLDVLEFNMKEYTYVAELADLTLHITAHPRGFTLKFGGYNHKLPLHFTNILAYIKDFVTSPQVFDVAKQTLMRKLNNSTLKVSDAWICSLHDYHMSRVQPPLLLNRA